MKEPDVCSTRCQHRDAVAGARAAMASPGEVGGLADLFKVLGDPTRVRILLALRDRELCVCDLAEVLSLTVSAVSHQLRVLRASKLVRFRRQGRMAFYALDDDHVHSLLAQGLDHVRE